MLFKLALLFVIATVLCHGEGAEIGTSTGIKVNPPSIVDQMNIRERREGTNTLDSCQSGCQNTYLQQILNRSTRLIAISSLRSCRLNCFQASGQWCPWSTCSQTCGGGTRTRTRTCVEGSGCEGSSTTETEICNTDPCPMTGTWGDWRAFGACSQSCGGGMQTRTRTCSTGSPSDCPGSDTETQPCNTDPCPIAGTWGTWSDFGACSQSCGGGIQTRTRTCSTGNDCIGSDTETQPCNTDPCPLLGSVENPATSCLQILDTLGDQATSGEYYLLHASEETPFLGFCDMDFNCNGAADGGWLRIANYGVSQGTCTNGFIETAGGCVPESQVTDCSLSTTFEVHSYPYTFVCGTIVGDQSSGDFVGFSVPDAENATIDDLYVEGVSLTYGSPRNHLWTFAGIDNSSDVVCPCFSADVPQPPTFVGNQYFCDDDPLWWDGQCLNLLECGCATNEPPLFLRVFSSPITEDIEMRVCDDGDSTLILTNIQIYVR